MPMGTMSGWTKQMSFTMIRLSARQIKDKRILQFESVESIIPCLKLPDLSYHEILIVGNLSPQENRFQINSLNKSLIKY